jgi:hypothetical protein
VCASIGNDKDVKNNCAQTDDEDVCCSAGIYIRSFHYSLFSLAFIFNTRKTEKEEDEGNKEEREEILLTSRNFRKT